MRMTHDVAVVIGRFQPLHLAHLAMLRRALELAPRVLVVIGSACQAPSPRNPFTWQERAGVLLQAVPPALRERLDLVPVPDLWDHDRWVAQVQALVARRAPAGARIALVGHRKDASSRYLADFPDWPLIDDGAHGDMGATQLRARLWSAPEPEAALLAVAADVPPATLDFLRGWVRTPLHARLAAQWRALEAERQQWAVAPYPPVFVTVDAVVEADGHVLLVRRGREPGRGLLALPGGFLDPDESLLQAALRELREETGLVLPPTLVRQALVGVQVFSHPQRSQRGRVITHAHHLRLPGRGGALPPVQAGDDAAQAVWMPLERLHGLQDRMHDDHWHILERVLGLGLPA